MDYKIYNLGDITLQSGKQIKKAYIAYKTYGTLNNNKDNVILYPTWYSGFIKDNEWLIGKDRELNPGIYFIIVVCLFGNGQSTSPSNNNTWSNTTLYDNVVNQHRLIKEVFGINKIKLVLGWSMGAQQTFQWASLFPDLVENILPFCGSAKTSPHNYVFLEGPKSTLMLSNNREESIKAFARVYSGWGFTQQFYKEKLWESLGFKSLENFLTGFWEYFFLQRNPENLLAMIWTWQHGDISDNNIYKGDLNKALQAIKAKCIILSPENDLYFPKEDNQIELEIMSVTNKNTQLVIIPGHWGHFAGGGLNPDDIEFINDQIKRLLN